MSAEIRLFLENFFCRIVRIGNLLQTATGPSFFSQAFSGASGQPGFFAGWATKQHGRRLDYEATQQRVERDRSGRWERSVIFMGINSLE
jgi:hypothetical protein